MDEQKATVSVSATAPGPAYPVVGQPVQVQDLEPMYIGAGVITSVTPGKDPDNPQVVVVVTRTYLFQGSGAPGDPTWWALPPA